MIKKAPLVVIQILLLLFLFLWCIYEYDYNKYCRFGFQCISKMFVRLCLRSYERHNDCILSNSSSICIRYRILNALLMWCKAWSIDDDALPMNYIHNNHNNCYINYEGKFRIKAALRDCVLSSYIIIILLLLRGGAWPWPINEYISHLRFI